MESNTPWTLDVNLRRQGRLLNVLCTFSLRSLISIKNTFFTEHLHAASISTGILYLTQIANQRKFLLGVKGVKVLELVIKSQMKNIGVEPILTEWMDQHSIEN